MVRVLLVDDSSAVRRWLSQELAKDPELEIVGAAPDAFVARDLIISCRPDVLVLDLEMPRMDGITFLQKMMKSNPLPVIVFSSLTQRGGKNALEAMAAGAVDVVCKPGVNARADAVALDLAARLKAVAKLKVAVASTSSASTSFTARGHDRVLVFGASTGGTVAVERILKALRPGLSRVLVVQHMPQVFTQSYAARLQRTCALEVHEAIDGESLKPGGVLVAAGDRHLVLRQVNGGYVVDVKDGPRINGHRPSIDATFASVATAAGKRSVAVLLTGMGRDGAQGLLEIRRAGGRTIAQDEASCVVFGMPRVAIELGAAEQVVALEHIPAQLVQLLDEI